MNMIVNSSDLVGYEAETKINTNKVPSKAQALKNLLKIWEGKQLKAGKKTAGFGLLAVSLAACNSDDGTDYNDADIAAATASGVASVDITADNAAAVTAALTHDGVAYASVAAAVTAGAATVDITSDNATVIAAATAPIQASLDAMTASYDALVVTNTALNTTYTDLVAPKSLSSAVSTVETLNGGVGDDTFTTTTALDGGDVFNDSSTTDNDTINATYTAGVTPSYTNIENANVSMNAAGAVTLNANTMSGVEVLTLTRGDVTIGSTVIAGNKNGSISNLDAADVAKVIAGVATNTFQVLQGTTGGVVIDADSAASTVTVRGPATVAASGMSATATLTLDAFQTGEVASAASAAVQNAKAVSVTTTAGTVNINSDTNTLTGPITVDAPAATTITIQSMTGGGSATTAAAGADITVTTGIDASGVTLTSGTSTTASPVVFTIDGSALTTDVATLAATGSAISVVSGGTTAIETLNFSGASGAASYVITGANPATSYIASGTNAVNLSGNESAFSGKTVTGAGTLTLSSGTAGLVDGSLWSADKVVVGFNNTNNAITVPSDANYEATINQTTGLDFNFATAANGSVNFTAGDVNGTSTSVGTLDVVALDANSAGSAGTFAITAIESNLTGTTLTTSATQNVTIAGDENVTFTGVVTTLSVDGNTSTGNIILTGLTNGVKTITTGSGLDQITVNHTTTDHIVVTGAGNDTLIITGTQNGSFSTSDGVDTITLTDVSAETYVVDAGAGNDLIYQAADNNTVIVGGSGTDTLRIDGTAAVNNNTTYGFSGIEQLELDAALTLSAAQFAANNTMSIITGSGLPTLTVTSDGTSTAGITIDATNLTSAITPTITYTGDVGNDSITGGVLAETFTLSLGNDSISGGGTGVDTLATIAEGDVDGATLTGDNSTGYVVNLGSTALDEATVVSELSGHFGNGLTQAAPGTGTFTFANATATTSGQINAAHVSSYTGIENVTGNDGDDYIVGSSGNNTINGGAGIDYVNGGDGNDTINVASSAESSSDKMHGGLGTDTIHVLATTALSATDASISGIENITMANGSNFDVDASDQTEGFTITGGDGNNLIIQSQGKDTINGAAGDDKIVFENILDGAASLVITNTTSAADDFVVSTSDADVVTFVVADDTVKIDGALEGVLENSAAIAASAGGNLDFNAVGIFVILNAHGDLDADNFGDISDVVANFNIANGTPQNLTAGDEILFAIENNAGTETGLYYFKDADANSGEISVGDTIALIAVFGDASMLANDFILT